MALRPAHLPIRREVQWGIYWVGIAVLAALWLGPVPEGATQQNIDLIAYERTVDLMREGVGYYPAAATALSDTLYPPRVVTQIRTPTIFWLWRWTGMSWPLSFVVLLICGWLVARLSWPLAGLGITVWLTMTAHTVGVEQWAYNETWALVFLLLAVWALRRERSAYAALAVLVAAVIRETTVLALVGGLVGAVALRRRPAAWVAALAAWSLFITWHVVQASRFVSPTGTGPSPDGTGLRAVMEMSGVWLGPLPVIVVVAALWLGRRTAEWFMAGPLLVAIPIAGFMLFRPYWSWLVLPLAVVMLRADESPISLRSAATTSSAGRPIAPVGAIEISSTAS